MVKAECKFNLRTFGWRNFSSQLFYSLSAFVDLKFCSTAHPAASLLFTIRINSNDGSEAERENFSELSAFPVTFLKFRNACVEWETSILMKLIRCTGCVVTRNLFTRKLYKRLRESGVVWGDIKFYKLERSPCGRL